MSSKDELVDPMALAKRAADLINETSEHLDANRKKRAWKASVQARKALEELSRILHPRAPVGPDPRQLHLPHTAGSTSWPLPEKTSR